MLSLLASVGVPIILDLFKSAGPAISRKFAGLSVDDQIKLESAQVQKLEALAKLDNPNGTPSQWVIDLRASFRYIAAAAIILVGGIIAALGISKGDPATIGAGLELAGIPFGFIFGERLVLSYKPMGK